MSDYMGSFFKMMNYFNTQMNNSSEYNIARVILNNVSELESLSLENLAVLSNTSPASVSRLIKKVGYSSYQDFRESFPKSLLEIKLNRKLNHVVQFPSGKEQTIVETLYLKALRNLNATKDHIDLTKLNQIVEMMKQSSSVTFYGDDHSLSIFYTLQLDLLSLNISSYLFKTEQIQHLHSQFMQEHSMIIFLNVFDSFITPEQRKLIKKIRQKDVKIVGFGQEIKENWNDFFDVVYHYGIPRSTNDGFYSLFYLSQILSELLMLKYR